MSSNAERSFDDEMFQIDLTERDLSNIQIKSLDFNYDNNSDQYLLQMNFDQQTIKDKEGQFYCIDSYYFHQIERLINTADYCDIKPHRDSGVLCAMVMVPPHSKVEDYEGNKYSIGQGNSSCSFREDFCPDEKEEFTNLINEVLEVTKDQDGDCINARIKITN